MPGLLNKISKFFKPLIDSLPSLDTILGVIKDVAPAIGSIASVIPGVGAVAPLIGNLVGNAAGTLGNAYSDYKGGNTQGAETAVKVIDTLREAIGDGKTVYKDYKAKKKATSVKATPPKKPTLLTKKLIENQ
jgi:phage-related protein